MRKTLLSTAIAAIVLLVVYVCSLADISLFSDISSPVAIFCQDREISEISFSENDHITIEARTSSNNPAYQWQIRIQDDLWADISEQTDNTLELSYAMTKSVLDDGFGAYVRCGITDENETFYSEPVCVTVLPAPIKYNNAIQPLSLNIPHPDILADDEYVTITINYLDGISPQRDQIFSPYTATLLKGSNFMEQNIISPTFIGYAPYYNAADTDTEDPDTANDPVFTLTLNLDNVDTNLVYNIYYKPIHVPYAAKYYFQNIYDDQYTENMAFYMQSTALTGTIIDDITLTNGVNAKGFTKLYHYPESVAADGSTVFECYYDRNYYLLKFDMNGGYGIDPIYARYDTPFVVNTPVRHGYVFLGWDLLDENGDGDGKIDTLPMRIPAQNRTYKAVWTTTETKYTEVYWLQNPDDNGYSYWGSDEFPAESNSKVNGQDRAPETLPDYRYTEFSHADTDIVVNGDGSTVVNVYYNRKVYTLKFYYAKKRSIGDYWIAGGSTWMFAEYNAANDQIDKMLDHVTHSNDSNSRWGQVVGVPTMNEKGQRLVENNTYQTGTTVTSQNNTYYYISFSARYGESIGDIWPLDIFNSIETSFEQYGKRAYFSAWNVENHSYYNHNNTNKTLKGNYLRLDYQLLYDPRYTDSSTVCFLGFWENGTTNVTWNYPNQLLYRIHLPTLDNQNYDSIFENVKYKLFAEYDTCDNNTDQNDGEQTATAVEGFTSLKRKSFTNGTVKGEDGYDRNSYIINFYYTRNNYTLEFNNNGDSMNDEAKTVPFEKNLAEFYFEPPYPDNLEENGYYFEGWYTSPGCYDGTKLDWETAEMPAASMMLYANWLPKTHTINIFKTYSAMLEYENASDENKDSVLEKLENEGLFLGKHPVSHGNTIGNLENPDSFEEYSFAGWFYMDSDSKKAYTPLDMPVTKDMNVFADWGSQTPQPYILHYALADAEKNPSVIALLNAERKDNITENSKYTITVDGVELSYIWLSGNYHLCIAGSTSGFGYQGTTRTFRPKAGAPYNQLYSQYNSGYFPTVGSHSITIQYEQDITNPVVNSFTFTYIQTNEIEYTVRYVNKDTGKPILDDKIGKSSDAVITERFVPIANYIPDAFYKRLILSVEEDPDNPGEYISSPSNLIIFYYSPNTTASFYAVHFMLQKAGTDGTDYNIDGSGDYENSGSTIEGIGDTNSYVDISPLSFSGFTLDETAYEVKNGSQTETSLNDGHITIKIDSSGTELYIFYKRNKHIYKTYYLEYGTSIQNMSELEKFNPDKGVLHAAKTVENVDYSTYVSEQAVSIDGYRCVSKSPQSITIGHEDNNNFIIFYYSPLQYTVEYHIAGNVGGVITQTSETIYGSDELHGSEVIPSVGYRFDGWFNDADCTIKASDSAKFIPQKDKLVPLPEVNVYYAKLTPQYGSIVIDRSNSKDESRGNQVFVYRLTNDSTGESIDVTVEGNGRTVVTNLLYGSYSIEQLNDWSWRYGDSGKSANLNNDSVTVEFEDDAIAEKWLSGNSGIEKNVKGD